MIRKMSQSQTNPQPYEEEAQNTDNHMTARTQIKLNNKLPLPQQYDIKK